MVDLTGSIYSVFGSGYWFVMQGLGCDLGFVLYKQKIHWEESRQVIPSCVSTFWGVGAFMSTLLSCVILLVVFFMLYFKKSDYWHHMISG